MAAVVTFRRDASLCSLSEGNGSYYYQSWPQEKGHLCFRGTVGTGSTALPLPFDAESWFIALLKPQSQLSPSRCLPSDGFVRVIYANAAYKRPAGQDHLCSMIQSCSDGEQGFQI